jgi:hypothetical protein
VALGCVAAGVGAALAASRAPVKVPRYGVYEQAFGFSTRAANPWEQVRLTVALRAPDGRRV